MNKEAFGAVEIMNVGRNSDKFINGLYEAYKFARNNDKASLIIARDMKENVVMIKESRYKELLELEQALTQEVSKDTNVEEVEEALNDIKDILEISVSEKIADKSIMECIYTIRNYITNVPKDVPNQSAKEIKPPLMVLKTNVGNCVVCDNEVTSEENYCSECGVQLKELQND